MTPDPHLLKQEPACGEQELNALHRLCRQALGNLTPADMVGLSLDETMALIAPDQVFLYGAEEGALVLQGVRPDGKIDLPEKKKIGECLCGLAGIMLKPVFSRNVQSDERCTLPECKAAQVRSFAALPLLAEQELLGVLGLASMTERDFSEQGIFLETLATTIALAIKKAKVFQELKQRIIDLENRVADCASELAIRNSELERLNRIFVDREFRIKELKVRLKSLENPG